MDAAQMAGGTQNLFGEDNQDLFPGGLSAEDYIQSLRNGGPWGDVMGPGAAGGQMDNIWGPGVSRIAEYTFQENNRYATMPEEENALELAVRLINEGKDQEAIEVLEIEVQRNPESSEGIHFC